MFRTIANVMSFISIFTITYSKPWDSEARDANWINRHKIFFNERRESANEIQVVFFGDSITEGWAGNGIEVWNKYYGSSLDTGVHAVNYGIGGDKTENLIWRVKNGEFERLMPKVIVLKIGTNNLGSELNDEDIVKGITAVVDNLHNRTVRAKILLLGVLPRNGHALQARIKKINSHIKGLYRRHGLVWYLDMWDQFSNSTTASQLNDHLFLDDKLHLAKQGYQVWADTMDPLFQNLYNSSYSHKSSIFSFISILLFLYLRKI